MGLRLFAFYVSGKFAFLQILDVCMFEQVHALATGADAASIRKRQGKEQRGQEGPMGQDKEQQRLQWRHWLSRGH